ncbi:MAG: glycosyltransferase family 2 protein, partial [Calditrichaeota bacterium]|nr:glycosyltransferase family 2 protein [Calditrichota bacterium]
IVVDDGSNDGTFQTLKSLKPQYPRLKALRFRKNYGKSPALAEGFKAAQGERVITMDADLQDDPAEIPALLAKLDEGYDMVSGWKKERHDPITKTVPSKLFNLVTSLMSGIRLHDFNCGLKAYRKVVVESLQVYGELHRFLPVLAHWHGFRVGELVVKHHPRKFGRTKFGLARFFNGFFDLMTVLFLTRFRTTPLHIFGMIGMAAFTLGFLIELYLTVMWFNGHGIGGRPLFFLGILLIIVGIQFVGFGLLAEMTSAGLAENVNYSIKEKIE